MGFIVTNRAFRFTFNNIQYALDVFNDGIVYDAGPAVHLLYMTANGWNRAHAEMEPVMYIRQADIDAAGGVVKLCELIRQKVNKALAILHGGKIDIPPGTQPHEIVADYLRNNLTMTVVNNVPVLQFKSGA